MSGEKESRQQSAERLAAEVLSLAKSTLMLNFRFLDRALMSLEPTVTEDVFFASDGRRLYYEPWYVLGQYKAEQTVVNRDLLHSLFHCVLRHRFVGKDIDRDRWDLACDVAVESLLDGLNSPCIDSRRQKTQAASLYTFRSEVGELSAERIYKWLGVKGLSPQEMKSIRSEFLGDSHGVWYSASADPNSKSRDIDLELMWQEISKRMQTELETLTENKKAPLVQSLRRLNRKKTDYRRFLQRFGVLGETMRLSDGEFDNNYYSYGMSLYGNMPLIEPLEYREQMRLRDFVIAIDTSGSVKGEVVQSFIQHTYNILSSQENLFEKVNIRIIQCDDRIRDDAVIHCSEDFDRYIENLEILGLGETDFRPVFSYVDELIQKGELKGLRGLIYFTDGLGEFPSKRPPYKTAFVLHCDDYSEPETPPWAIKTVLTEDEILDRRFCSR